MAGSDKNEKSLGGVRFFVLDKMVKERTYDPNTGFQTLPYYALPPKIQEYLN